MSPSSGKYTRRVSLRNAAAFEARKFSPSPIPTTSGVSQPRGDEQIRVVGVDDDEREVPLELENAFATASTRSPS